MNVLYLGPLLVRGRLRASSSIEARSVLRQHLALSIPDSRTTRPRNKDRRGLLLHGTLFAENNVWTVLDMRRLKP